MSIHESVNEALETRPSIVGAEQKVFGGVNFKFGDLSVRLTPVDLGEKGTQGLRAYIDIIKRSQCYTPLKAMIIEIDKGQKMMAVEYDFDEKKSVFLHDIDPDGQSIFLNGHIPTRFSSSAGGFQLADNPNAKTMVEMRDSGAGTLTLDIEMS